MDGESLDAFHRRLQQDPSTNTTTNGTDPTPNPLPVPTQATYDPNTVDWASVVTACRLAGAWEKRFRNFWIRAAFHDGGAINPSDCSAGATYDACFAESGLDASLLLNANESALPENAYDNFTALTTVMTVRIATVYNTSVADALAVCAAVAAEDAGDLSILSLKKLRVGRVDSTKQAPRVLPKAVIGTQEFTEWFKGRGFSVAQAVALLGSHSMLDETGCAMADGSRCDPTTSPCTDVRMFTLDNVYYHELCTPTIVVDTANDFLDGGFVDTPIDEMGDVEFKSLLSSETCKWTSPDMRKFVTTTLDLQRGGKAPIPPEAVLPIEALWFSPGCDNAPPGVDKSITCPRFQTAFPYTVNDAFLGLACQGAIANPNNSTNTDIRTAMRNMLNKAAFKTAFRDAFLQLLNGPAKSAGSTVQTTYVTSDFAQVQATLITSDLGWITIDGTECPSGIDSATGKCKTAAASFDEFKVGIALPVAIEDTDPSLATPLLFRVNRQPTIAFAGSPTAFTIRRLDNNIPLSIAEIEVYDTAGNKVTIPAAAASSSVGAAAAVVDGSTTTAFTIPVTSWEQWVTIQIPPAVIIGRIIVTHGLDGSSLVGVAAEYVTSTGSYTEIVPPGSKDYTIWIAAGGFVIAPGRSTEATKTAADSTLNLIITSYNGGAFTIGTVDVYSRNLLLPTPTITRSAAPVTIGGAQISWLRIAVPLPALVRADRIVIASPAGLAGDVLYYGEPGMAGAGGVSTAAVADTMMTVFVGDAVSAVAGNQLDVALPTMLELSIYSPLGNLPLNVKAADVKLMDEAGKTISVRPSAYTITPTSARVNLEGLPDVRRAVVSMKPASTLTGAIVRLMTTTGTFFSQVSSQGKGAKLTVWTSFLGINVVSGTPAAPVPEDVKPRIMIARTDGRPIELGEVAFFDEKGTIMEIPTSAISASTPIPALNLLDGVPSTTVSVPSSGKSCWITITLPTAASKMVLAASSNVDGMTGAYLYARDPRGGVASGFLGATDLKATQLTVYFGVSSVVSIPDSSYVFTGSSNEPVFNPSNKPFPSIPPSPYLSDLSVCNKPQEYTVDGFPSSPHMFKPFTKPFRNPITAAPAGRACRTDGHCVTAYDITVKEMDVDLGCATPTTFISYNGSVPGPTLFAPVGEEVLVRYRNTLVGGVFGAKDEYPCVPSQNRGRGTPLSVHNHGQASVAPHDGWAENRICGGESKDYLYANNRPATGWCHDHGLDITAANAYHGAAMFYIMSVKKGFGSNCGEPWNLDKIPEYFFLLNDKLLDSKCQLRIDIMGVHSNNFYGDVNVVSGIPWPVLTVQPQFVRLRFLSGGPTRPFHIHIINNNGKNIGAPSNGRTPGSRCKIIGADGGFFPTPVDMPREGLFVAVAERYEMVCDFTGLDGQTLYIWNAVDKKRTKAVPFFCYSHLLVKINVLKGCHGSCTGAELKPAGAGNDMICGGKCYTKNASGKCNGLDRARACCPAGQICWRKDAQFHYCRTAGPAATCALQGALEILPNGDQRCGGKCFRDSKCKGPAAAQACCPEGQYCLAQNASSFICKPNPATIPGAKDSGLGSCASAPTPQWPAKKNAPLPTSMDKVLTPANYKAALAMANSGKSHRQFKFGRRHGEWVINGETWHTFKIAANDVGQNAWEVWELKTGGGWFHPIHIHLVDFWVIRRKGSVDSVEPYEYFAPKDVVALHPSQTAWILARWGPHRGDYMFHCHNLIHEDRAMMRAFTVGAKDGLNAASKKDPVDFTLLNTATNMVYDDYNAKDPMAFPASTSPPAFNQAYWQQYVNNNLYRIFYPTATDAAVLRNATRNPWLVARYNSKAAKCPA